MDSSYWINLTGNRLSRRRALAVTAGGAAAAFLAACGGSSDTAGDTKSSLISQPVDTTKQSKRGGTSKWFISAEPTQLDVHIAEAPHAVLKAFVYSNLTQTKPGHLEPSQFDVMSDLAESWEWSPDKLQLTMKLRQGVKWHNKPPVDGRLLDIQDVLFSWQRYSAKATDRGTLSNAANPGAPVLSVSAVDATTFVFKLKEPLVFLLSALAAPPAGRPMILPRETDNGFDIRRDMIGTGPFVLEKYTSSVGFNFKRNPEYWEKDSPLVDRVEVPIVLEYAAALAQLKAGNIYTYPVRGDDILSIKQDVPEIKLYQSPSISVTNGDMLRFGVQPLPENKPFRDERVRQAISMSYDRDLYIDTFNNVSSFRNKGLPVDVYWYTAIGNIPGWWLDPKSKDFGPNAKYFQYNVAEAKKLLAAAGYGSGLEVKSNVVAGTERGPDYHRLIEVKENFASQIGLKITRNPVDYAKVYIPNIRDGRGNFEGMGYASGSASADDAVAYMVQRYYSKGPASFLGFDVNGTGDHSGDPRVDADIDRAKAEPDTEKRKAIVHELQRYLAKAAYGIPDPGGASGFELAWPVLGNYRVYDRDNRGPNYRWWIDETQAPIKKA